MAKVKQNSFVLKGAIGADDIESWSGKLSVVEGQTGKPQSCIVLDCFDQKIRKSGRVLLETGGELLLYCGKGDALKQPARRDGDFVSDLAEGPVKAAIDGMFPLRCLLPVASGTVVLRRLAVVDGGKNTHARLHLQHFVDGCPPFTLARLQSLRGYGQAAKELRRILLGLGGRPADAKTIYPLLAPGVAPYVAKPKIPLTGNESAFGAATDIIRSYFAVARQNEAGAAAGLDTEFLHDYRVALRKIRSVLSLFKRVFSAAATARLKKSFSRLMAPTGRLRDLDVYLLERQSYFDLLPPTLHTGLTVIFDAFEAERAVLQAALAKRFRSAAYKRETGELQVEFEHPQSLLRGPKGTVPAHTYAQMLIWKRYRKICRIAARISGSTPDEEVHKLRINCKKLRYLMEFFAPLFPPKDCKLLLKPLKLLQDNLGLINDYSVQQVSLREFVRSSPAMKGAMGLEAAQSIGALIAILHQRQSAERARVAESFSTFNSSQTQDRFRFLFHCKLPQS
ncbi:CHAD domain-containing protein [Leisingera sp. JC11]|uniref:CHAD domain-containing protein n=1 Tax=Leisingera sp. JC11 TaxID=3042469 RepID=UPI0034570406